MERLKEFEEYALKLERKIREIEKLPEMKEWKRKKKKLAFENTEIFKEYTEKRKEYEEMVKHIENLREIVNGLYSFPYRGLEGKELEKRIKLLSKIYGKGGVNTKFEELKKEFIKHINTKGYYEKWVKQALLKAEI